MSTASRRTDKPTLVVTGSDGLIGSAVVRGLHERYNIVGIDNDRTSDIEGLRDLIYCDLTDDSSVREAFNQLESRHGTDLASVIHLAAYYDFSGEESPLYEELTVEGTRRLLQRLQRFEVGQFIFASTLLVMKPSQDGHPINEESPLQAEWEYPKSKLKTEELIANEQGRIPAVILRIAGVYDEWGRAVPIAQQMRRIHDKDLESYLYPGDSSHGQSMIHMDDVVSCIARTVERRSELGPYEVFLIGEDSVMSYDELQEQIGELLHGEEWPAIRIPKAVAKLGAQAKSLAGEDEFIKPWMVDLADQDYRIDISKARRLLGWEPRHTLRNTLPKIAGRLLDDEAQWTRKNGLEAPAESEAK